MMGWLVLPIPVLILPCSTIVVVSSADALLVSTSSNFQSEAPPASAPQRTMTWLDSCACSSTALSLMTKASKDSLM